MSTGQINLMRGDALDFGHWGRLEFSEDRQWLILRTISYPERRLRLCEPFVGSSYVYYRIDLDSGGIVLIGGASRAIYHLTLPKGQLYVAMCLYRRSNDNYGLYRMTLHEIGTSLLIIYEGGILYLDENARCPWKVDHDYIDRLFVTVADDVAWYESEHEGTWGYRLSDGARVEQVEQRSANP